jgi:hypothetical protein
MAGEREPVDKSMAPLPSVEVVNIEGEPNLAVQLFPNNPFAFVYPLEARLPQKKLLSPKGIEEIVPPEDDYEFIAQLAGEGSGVSERVEIEVSNDSQELGIYFQNLFTHFLQKHSGSTNTDRFRGLNPQYSFEDIVETHIPPALISITRGDDEKIELIQDNFIRMAESAAHDFIESNPLLKRVIETAGINDAARILGNVAFMVSPGQEYVLKNMLQDNYLNFLARQIGTHLGKRWENLHNIAQAFREDPDFSLPYELIKRDWEFWEAINNHVETRKVFDPNKGDSLSSAQILEIAKYLPQLKINSDFKKIFNFLRFCTPYNSYDLNRIATHIRTSEGQFVKITRSNGHRYPQEMMASIALNTTKTDAILLHPTIDKRLNPGRYQALQKLIDNFVICTKKKQTRDVRNGRRKDTIEAKVSTRFMLDPSSFTTEEFEQLGRLAQAILKGEIALSVIENKIHTYTTRVKRNGNDIRIYDLSPDQIRSRLQKRDSIGHHDEPVFRFLLMALEYNEHILDDPEISSIIRTVKRFNTGHIKQRPDRLKDMVEIKRKLPPTISHVTVGLNMPLFKHMESDLGVRRILLVNTEVRYNLAEQRRIRILDMMTPDVYITTYPTRFVFKMALQQGRKNPKNILAMEDAQNRPRIERRNNRE